MHATPCSKNKSYKPKAPWPSSVSSYPHKGEIGFDPPASPFGVSLSSSSKQIYTHTHTHTHTHIRNSLTNKKQDKNQCYQTYSN